MKHFNNLKKKKKLIFYFICNVLNIETITPATYMKE